MKKLFIIIQLFIWANSNFAQQIQSILTLDTIISTHHLTANDEPLVGAIYADYFWTYVPSWKDNDSLLFLKLNLNTYHMDSIWTTLPSISSKTKTPIANNIAVNAQYIVLYFFKTFAVFKITSSHSLEYKTLTPLVKNPKYIHLLDNQILFGQYYNYHPLEQSEKTLLAVYDIPTEKFIEEKYPPFANIEFSYFSPNHWIDATDKKILFAQTTEYHIDIFDKNLKKLNEINRKVADWNGFDSSILVSLRKQIEPGRAKAMIDSLSPYEDKVSRLETAHFINDSTIIVKYIPTDNKNKKRLRLFDVWQLINNEWKLTVSDLKDEKPMKETVIEKQNFPLLAGMGNNELHFANNKLLIIKPGADIWQTGKKYEHIKKEEDDYYIKNDPQDFIYVYYIKLNR